MIKWSGGNCPVEAGTDVNVKFRNGQIYDFKNPEDCR